MRKLRKLPNGTWNSKGVPSSLAEQVMIYSEFLSNGLFNKTIFSKELTTSEVKLIVKKVYRKFIYNHTFRTFNIDEASRSITRQIELMMKHGTYSFGKPSDWNYCNRLKGLM